jgi:hypothetical protein
MTTLVNFLAVAATAVLLVGGLTVVLASLLLPGLGRDGR